MTANVRSVALAAPDDVAGWRKAARNLLAANTPPECVIWEHDGERDLLAGQAADTLTAEAPPFRVPRQLLSQLQLSLLHSAPDRFALAYRLLWRLRDLPSLSSDMADPDVMTLNLRAKAVRRDLHKMHAFVRFRKVGEADGREQFAAWFEPAHHIGRTVAPFFRNRFTGMDWLIVTPAISIAWDGTVLREGPGGTRGDVPASDAVEQEWRAYYASIFNPARVKIAAMKKEMPVRYWRNLPEAPLIAGLVASAGTRVGAMVRQENTSRLATIDETPQQTFANLDALYAALKQTDTAPAPEFSDTIVPGEGPRNARILFVGEQPGDQEDRTGRPFVGPAGQLLRSSLKEAGIDEQRVFFTNAVKRFKFVPRGKRRLHQTPTTSDIKHYRWWLAEELRIVDPVVVVALGATALHGLTGKRQALGPLRDTLMPWNGRQVLATIHPSFLLRLPDEQAREIERGRFLRALQTLLHI